MNPNKPHADNLAEQHAGRYVQRKAQRVFFRRLLGLLLSLFAAASLLVSVFCLLQTWVVQARIANQLILINGQAQDLLDHASAGLRSTEQTISATINSLSAVRPPLLSVANGVHNAQPSLDELQTLTGKSIPATITSTQASLQTAQQSAAAMETILRLVSQIPFFPGGKYEPQVSLEQSLGLVANDLNSMRQPLANMQTAIQGAQGSLVGLDNQIIQLILLLDQIRYQLEFTNHTVEENRQGLVAVKNRLAKMDPFIANWARAAAFFVSFVLVWIAMAQLAWLEKGVRWVASRD